MREKQSSGVSSMSSRRCFPIAEFTRAGREETLFCTSPICSNRLPWHSPVLNYKPLLPSKQQSVDSLSSNLATPFGLGNVWEKERESPTLFWEFWGMDRNPSKGHLSLGAYQMAATGWQSHYGPCYIQFSWPPWEGDTINSSTLHIHKSQALDIEIPLRLHSELGAGLG